MDEALILQKLDELSSEVRTLKAELKKKPKSSQPTASFFEECLEQSGGEHTREDLAHLMTNLFSNIEMLNSLMGTVKGTMEFKEEIEPIAKLAYPIAIDTAAEVAEGFDPDQLKPLIRNLLSNMENFNTALNMLKAAMELKDDIEPLAKLAYPIAIETATELTENMDMDQVMPLIRNTMGNLENFNTALTMLKAGMELKDDIEPLAKLSLPMITDFFAGLSGLMKVSGTALNSVKDMGINEEQAEAMSKVIREIDLSKSNKVNIFTMLKKLNQREVQEALGATFTMLGVFGSLLEAYRNNAK